MEYKARSNNFLNGIIFAISYFSTLPVTLKSFEADDRFYRGVIYGLPITGALLALCTIFAFFILNTIFPAFYSAFLSSIFYLFLYGFIHLEAVCDTVDGWYASLSNKDIHKVMKEPQIGAMGAIFAFCVVLLKVAVLSYLLYLEAYLWIVLALVFSRFSLYFLLELEIHEKSSFLIFMKKAKEKSFIVDSFLFFINFLVKQITKRLVKKIGFINGDIAGFSIEIIELVLLHIFLFMTL